jgi:hypothetical protein
MLERRCFIGGTSEPSESSEPNAASIVGSILSLYVVGVLFVLHK